MCQVVHFTFGQNCPIGIFISLFRCFSFLLCVVYSLNTYVWYFEKCGSGDIKMNKIWHLCFQKCLLFYWKNQISSSLQKLIFHPPWRGAASQEAPHCSSKSYLDMLFTTNRFLVFFPSHWNFNVVICFLTKLSFLTVVPSFIYLGLSCVKKWSLAYSRLSFKGFNWKYPGPYFLKRQHTVTPNITRFVIVWHRRANSRPLRSSSKAWWRR